MREQHDVSLPPLQWPFVAAEHAERANRGILRDLSQRGRPGRNHIFRLMDVAMQCSQTVKSGTRAIQGPDVLARWIGRRGSTSKRAAFVATIGSILEFVASCSQAGDLRFAGNYWRMRRARG